MTALSVGINEFQAFLLLLTSRYDNVLKSGRKTGGTAKEIVLVCSYFFSQVCNYYFYPFTYQDILNWFILQSLVLTLVAKQASITNLPVFGPMKIFPR